METKARKTVETSVLVYLREHYAATNAELRGISPWYTKAVHRLRNRGIDIRNVRASEKVGNDEGSLYMIVRDNYAVVPWYKGYYTVAKRKPIVVTTVENRKAYDTNYWGNERGYEIGRSERTFWDRIFDFFTSK